METNNEEPYIVDRKAWILSFLVHHKTGTHVADAIKDVLHLDGWEYRKDNHFPQGVNRDDGHYSWPVSRTFEHLFYNGTMKVVHFVRDPIDVIVSAYNYHMKALEPWLLYGDTQIWNGCPKHTKTIADCLRNLSKSDGLREQTRNMLREIREMHWAFQNFERWPDRSVNICLWEFKRNVTAAVNRICNMLGPETCDTKEVVKNVIKNFYIGNCNSHAVGERRATECRPSGVIGECGGWITNACSLEQCIKNIEKENSRETNITCCVDDVLYGVKCYDRPQFEPVTRDEYYDILQTEPLLFDEMVVLSRNMGCRLETDTKPNMEPYKHFVDEELIIALDQFLEFSPDTTESSLLEELQKAIQDLPEDFLTKVRLPAGLKMGAPYRTPVLDWLLQEIEKINDPTKNMTSQTIRC